MIELLPKDPDRLFPLMAEGPKVTEKLSGKRFHKSVLFRHARKGVYGVKLKTVSVGRTLMTTPRWLLIFWDAIAKARR